MTGDDSVPEDEACRVCNGDGEREAILNGTRRKILCGRCGGDGVAR